MAINVASSQTSDSGGSSDVLGDAVAALLRRIPEIWAEYDADALTATESQALFLLVAAGMVERRGRFRVRMHNHPLAVEATITATGECGLAEAMECVTAAMWDDWKGAFQAWQTSETRSAPKFWSERLKPDEWRLTDQGALGRADIGAGEPTPLDLVLRRGFFDENPYPVLDPGRMGGRIGQRKPVRGAGRVIELRKVRTDSVSTANVNIANWNEGAESFAKAFTAFKPGVRAGDPAPAPSAWVPPPGFVGTKAITSSERFRKDGKNPPRTTIDHWITRAGDTLKREMDPATREVYLPETWVLEQIRTWNPRS